MNTDELIRKLSRAEPPASLWPAFPFRPALLTMAVGLMVVAVIGLRSPLLQDPGQSGYRIIWFALISIAIGLYMTLRLVSPTERPGIMAITLPVVAVFVISAVVGNIDMPPIGRVMECSALIVLIAFPGLAASLIVLKRGATRYPHTLGAFAGLMITGLSTLAFSLHCPDFPGGSGLYAELLSIAFMAGSGAFLGRRMLRW